MTKDKNKWAVHGISFSGKEWLWDAIVAKAKSQRRSVSNFICGLLEDDLKQSGDWPPNPTDYKITPGAHLKFVEDAASSGVDPKTVAKLDDALVEGVKQARAGRKGK